MDGVGVGVGVVGEVTDVESGEGSPFENSQSTDTRPRTTIDE